MSLTRWDPTTRQLEPVHRGHIVERRDPSAATQPLRYVSPGLAQVDEWDAEQAIRLAFYSNVIVYRCVQIIANTIASLPFRAGRRPPERPGEFAEHDPNARLATLLGPPPGGPAPKLSARRLWAWTVAQRIVTGRHAWEVETDGDRIAALWPLTSASLRAIPSTGGTDWFRAFKYGPAHQQVTLGPDRVVYGWNPSLNDFRQPESDLQAARLDISIAVMMDRYNVAFLRNDARPAAVVVTEAFANSDQKDAFQRQWHAMYGGVDNAGRVAFHEVGDGDGPVSDSIHIEVLGLSQKDARFIEQHKASLERVAMAIGVPWSKLDASGRTFDNASEEDHAWWESTILPKLADFQDEVNMQLAPRVGREVGWFDTSGVRALQPPRRFTNINVGDLLDRRVIVPNEVRGDLFLDPIEGGDQPLALPEPAAEPEPVVPDTTADLPADMQRQRQPETRAMDAEAMEVRRTRIWRTTDAIAVTLERRWERAFRRLFERQRKAVISRLEGNRGQAALREQRAPTDDVFDLGFWRTEAAEVAADLYEQVMAAGAARVSDQFAIAFDLEAAFAQEFVQARANMLAGQVTETTYSAIRDALAEGVGEGESIPDLAARIRHVFEVATEARATVIARTEVVSAFNASASLTAAQLPADVVAGQEWIATRDGRTRADHAEADGQVVGMGQPFNVGGSVMAYPGDPAGGADQTVQCRCTVAFLTPDEMAERAGATERRAKAEHLWPLLPLLVNRPLDELAVRRAYREAAA